MTEQLYRHIHYTQNHIKSVWFGWRRKNQTNKSYSLDEATQWLTKEKSNPRKLFLSKEWSAMLDNVINDVNSGQFKAIQQEREYRTFPTHAYSYYNDSGELKRSKASISLPWILLSQPKMSLPVRTPLHSFDISQLPPKATSQKKSKTKSLFKPVKIIGVIK